MASGQGIRDFPNAPDCLVYQKCWRLPMPLLCPLPPSVEPVSSLADVPGIRRISRPVSRPVPQCEDRALIHPFPEYRQLATKPLPLLRGQRSQLPIHAGVRPSASTTWRTGQTLACPPDGSDPFAQDHPSGRSRRGGASVATSSAVSLAAVSCGGCVDHLVDGSPRRVSDRR